MWVEDASGLSLLDGDDGGGAGTSAAAAAALDPVAWSDGPDPFGPTSTARPCWGHLTDVSELDALAASLEPKGLREGELKKGIERIQGPFEVRAERSGRESG